jgi:hypothetical protein
MKNTENIITFTDLYERTVSEGSLISVFITGHLVLEFLLIKIIEISQPKLLGLAEELNHYKLIQLVYGLNFINEDQRDVLVLINKIRNKFAHKITYSPTIEEIESLFKKASSAFEDFTDGISQGLEEIKGKNSLNDCEHWVISELFVQISYDLHGIYQKLGGDIENF